MLWSGLIPWPCGYRTKAQARAEVCKYREAWTSAFSISASLYGLELPVKPQPMFCSVSSFLYTRLESRDVWNDVQGTGGGKASCSKLLSFRKLNLNILLQLAVLCLGKCGWGDDVEEREAWQPGKAISTGSGAELWASVNMNTKSWPLLSTQNISHGNLHFKVQFKRKFRIHSRKVNAKLFAAKASQSKKQASRFWGLSPSANTRQAKMYGSHLMAVTFTTDCFWWLWSKHGASEHFQYYNSSTFTNEQS